MEKFILSTRIGEGFREGDAFEMSLEGQAWRWQRGFWAGLSKHRIETGKDKARQETKLSGWRDRQVHREPRVKVRLKSGGQVMREP